MKPSDHRDHSRVKITGDVSETSTSPTEPTFSGKGFAEAQGSGADVATARVELPRGMSLTLVLERSVKCPREATLHVTRVSPSRVVIDLVADQAVPEVPSFDRAFLEILADQFDRGQRAVVSKADFLDQVRGRAAADAKKD